MDFQTPKYVCVYMASFLPDNAGTILEPTPGEGNLVEEISKNGMVIAPKDFFELRDERFDWVVMNPPFTPMKLGYDILYKCMNMSNNIIALMPWLTIINSEKRSKDLFSFGLISVTHLPRNVFAGSRVQTCILQLNRGYKGDTKLLNFSSLESQKDS